MLRDVARLRGNAAAGRFARQPPRYPTQHGATRSVTTGRTRSTTHATRHGAAWREVQPSCGPVAQHEAERERCSETWQPRNAGERGGAVGGRTDGRPPGHPPPLTVCGGVGNGVCGMVDSGWVRSGSIILGACRTWQHGQPKPPPIPPSAAAHLAPLTPTGQLDT